VGPGGRIFAVVGDLPVMKARLVHCPSKGVIASDDLFETVVAPLVNAPAPPRFVF
jgi:protein-L-isoaspartate(D-aspartate) O-methyltransferase